MDGYYGCQEKQVKEEMEGQPASMNAFELISLNKGLNLGNFFEADKVRNCSSIVSHESLYNICYLWQLFTRSHAIAVS